MSNNKSVNDGEWRGYTLEELQYRRAKSLARCIVYRQQMKQQVAQFARYGNQGGKRSVLSLIGALAPNMKFINYVMIGIKLSKYMLPVLRWIKRR